MKRKYTHLIFSSFLLLLSSHLSLASEIIPNQYIVVFENQQLVGQARSTVSNSGESVRSAAERLVNEAIQNQLLIKNRTSVQSSITNELGAVYEHALKGFSAQLTPEAAIYLSNQPEIDYVIPDQTTELHAVQVSPPAWGLDRIDQEDLPLDQSYEYLTDGTAVHAYIIDSGIRASHNEFTGRVGNGYDAIDKDNNPVDCNGHGTHVAGTVAGNNYGVAKNVVIHPVRVFGCGSDDGSFSDIIEGINWILANLQLPAVANMSLGGEAYTPLDTAVNDLINAGVTTVISAGNDNGGDACNKSPARVANSITVASSTISDQRSSFSNVGSCVDIFAPGSSIRSAWYTSNTATGVLSGTSMSAPHVAGVVALYLEENTASTPAQVSNVITANATANRISNAGSGTPNRLLFSQLIGAPPPPEEIDLAWLVPIINLILF